jgi:hypothetical protein
MQSEKLARLRKVPVAWGGVTYNLCGEFAALIEAEEFFNIRGHNVNLLVAIGSGRNQQAVLAALRQLIPCALHTFHPKLSWEEAQALIDQMVARDDDASFLHGIDKMWPPMTAEREEANRNLRFDLDSLADASEHFAGQAKLSLMAVPGLPTFENTYRVFPCAVHHHRPELDLDQARQLMTLPSVFLVVKGLDQVRQEPEELQKKFGERLGAAASDEEREDFLFRNMAQKQGSENIVN